VSFELRGSGEFSAFLAADFGQGEVAKGASGVEGRTIRLTLRPEQLPAVGPELDRQPLCMVPWGEHVFLVADDKLEAFTRDVNGGSVFRQSRRGGTIAGAQASDLGERVFGIPELPGERRKRIQQTAIVGITHKVLARDLVRLTVDTKHDAKSDMHFGALDADPKPAVFLEVSEIAETNCRARMLLGGPQKQGSGVIALVPLEPATSSQPLGAGYPSSQPSSPEWRMVR
jgi:hypothetical protein